MTKTEYAIFDDFNARQIYEKAIFYSAMDAHKDAEIIERSADNIKHQWREDVIEFKDLKTKVRLRLHNYPNAPTNKGLPAHALEIKFSGEKIESAKERLKGLTGINF